MSITPLDVNKSYITQIVDNQGNATGQTTVTPDFFLAEPNIYAPLRRNNKVTFFTTGEDYFTEVGKAIEQATESIYITGWQINYDVNLKGLDFEKIKPLQTELEQKQYRLDQLSDRVDNYLRLTPEDERKTLDQIFTARDQSEINSLRARIEQLNDQIASATKDKTLWSCLRTAVQKGVKVYVLPWSCPLVGPVVTYDLETMCAIYQLNIGLEEKKAFFMFSVSKSDMTGGSGETYTVGDAIQGIANDMFFSHHQKSIIIDNKIGFLGGIDLAYGRRDTADFSLKSHERWGNDRYNPCIPPMDAALRAKHVSRLALILSTLADISAPAATVNGFFTIKDIFTRISNWWNTPIAWDIAYAFRNFKSLLNKKFESIKESLLETFFDPVLGWVMRLGIDLTLLIIAIFKRNMQNYLADIKQHIQEIDLQGVTIDHSATLESILAKVNAKQQLTPDDYLSIIPALRNWYANTPEGQLFSSIMDQDISFMKPEQAKDTNNLLASLVAQLFAALDEHVQRPEAQVYKFLEEEPQPLLPRSGFMLNKTQPRMPWQDVQMQTQGPAVYDLSRNFINRWNAGQMFMDIEKRDNRMQKIEAIRMQLKQQATALTQTISGTILRYENLTTPQAQPPAFDYTQHNRTDLIIAGLFEFVHVVIKQGEEIVNIIKDIPLIGSVVEDIEGDMINFAKKFVTAVPTPYYIAANLPKPPQQMEQAGNDLVQIIRSAPKALLEYEARAQIYSKTALPPYFSSAETPQPIGSIEDETGKISPAKVQALIDEMQQLLTTPQSDCHKAWLKAISSAQDYIYIENQFFQSNFGEAFGYRKTITEEEIEQLGADTKSVITDLIARSGPMNSLLFFDDEVYPLIKEMGADKALNELDIRYINLAKVKEIFFRLAGYQRGVPAKPRLLLKLKDQLSSVWLSQFTGKLTQLFFGDTPQENEQNGIIDGLAKRISRAIDNNENFHVYVVLPVHPEGMLNSDSVMHMVHLAMQTIYNGKDSLIKRIQKAMCAKRLRDQGASRADAEQMVYNSKARNEQLLANASPTRDNDFITSTQVWSSVLDATGNTENPAEVEPDFVSEDWTTYLTLLNLRNWDQLGGSIFGWKDKIVTEQIYIHSKLIIVDDNIAIIGSCNINDRSMLGGRDSELAAIVRGGEQVKVALNGKQIRTVSKTVQQFRIKLWRKIFGLDIKDPDSKVKPATNLTAFLEKPAAPKTVAAIRERAETNTKAYNAAFDFIPQDDSPVQQEKPQPNKGLYPKIVNNVPYYPLGCSIWPLWFYNDPDDHLKGGKLKGQMPFQEEFWKEPLKKYPAPKGIEGFITLLPIKWTMGEGNLSFSSNSVYAKADRPTTDTRTAQVNLPNTNEEQST